MSDEPLLSSGRWMAVSAVATMMKEDHLSKDEAMAMLRGFVSEEVPSEEMQRTIEYLETMDEGDLQAAMGQEGLRLMKLDI